MEDSAFITPIDSRPALVKFSRMEHSVVRLVTLGCTGREIAVILDRSLHTVINHKNRAMAKVGAHNVATLTRYALVLNVTTLDDTLTPQELAILEKLRAEARPKTLPLPLAATEGLRVPGSSPVSHPSL